MEPQLATIPHSMYTQIPQKASGEWCCFFEDRFQIPNETIREKFGDA